MLFAAVLVLVGMAAFQNEANLLLLLVGIAAGALGFNVIAPAWMIRKIEVQRIVPEGLVAARPFKLVYVVRSRHRWLNCWSIVVGEKPGSARGVEFPRAFAAFLPAGAEQRIELTAQCPYRGKLSLPSIRVTSRFPFGLFSCSVDWRVAATTVVYPTVGRLTRDLWKDRRSGSAASRRHSRSTDQQEFNGVREYRHGDNYRWIHWRRSARTGELMVREMMPLRPAQLLVLLDPWPTRDTNQGMQASAESVIAFAATTLCEYLHRGHRVGLICRCAAPVVIPPGSGPAQRQRLLEELALIAPPAGEGLDQIITQVRWSHGWHAQCLVCSTRADVTHQRVVRFLAPRAEAVTIMTPEMEGYDTLMDMAKEPPLSASGRRQ
jgi:uncharacterized protein (DUF58 family)